MVLDILGKVFVSFPVVVVVLAHPEKNMIPTANNAVKAIEFFI